MRIISLLSATLGLAAPWGVTGARFSDTGNRVDIFVEYLGDTPIPCPHCGTPATVSSCAEETWYHSTFFHFAAYLHAQVPVVVCPRCGETKIADSWAGRAGGFSPLPSDELC